MGQTLSRKDRILNGDKVAFPTKSEQILMKHVAEGGSGGGGLQLKNIATNPIVWPASGGGGMVTYFQVTPRNENNESLAIISIDGGGAPATFPNGYKLEGDSGRKICTPLVYTKQMHPIDTIDKNTFGLSSTLGRIIKEKEETNISTLNAVVFIPVKWHVDEEGNPLT